MRWWGIYHIQSFWVHGYWYFYHTMKSEAIYCIMNCRACIYRLMMVSLLHITIIFMLITFNKTWYNHVLNAYYVSLIVSVDPSCISTSSFHVYVKVINKKVGNTCWVCKDSIFINYHTFAWVLFIFQFYYYELNDADRGLFEWNIKYL